MSIHQEHFGKKFYQDKKTGYWISTTCPKIRAHVWVWNHYHGDVPKGMHIHHRDLNKSNNDFSNLSIVSVKEHSKIHFELEPDRVNKCRERADKYRHLTKEWHASEEGKAWHKAHGILGWINREPIKMKCKQCDKEFETKTYHQDFCSNACKSKWRRHNKLDDIEKICPICSNKYMSSKYSRSKTCSKVCGVNMRKKK